MADIFEPLNLDSPSPLNPKTVTDDRTTLDGFQIYRGLTLYDKTAPAGVYVYTGVDNSNVADDWIRVDASGGLIDQEDGTTEVTWDSEATLAFAEGPTHVPGRIYEVDVPDTTFTTVPIGFGGTGATNATEARTNLGITDVGDTFPTELVFIDGAANQFTVGQKNRIRTNTNTGNFTFGVADAVGDGADISGETGTEGQVTVIQNQSGASKTLIYKTGTGQPQLFALQDDSFTQFKSNGTGWVIISRSVRQGGNIIFDTGNSLTLADGTNVATAADLGGGGLVDQEDGDAITWDSEATLAEATTPGMFVEDRIYEVDVPAAVSDFVTLDTNQTITGDKTFDTGVTFSDGTTQTTAGGTPINSITEITGVFSDIYVDEYGDSWLRTGQFREPSMFPNAYVFSLYTSSTTNTLTVPTTESPGAIKWNPTGTKLYFVEGTADVIREYTLTTPYDLTTATISFTWTPAGTTPFGDLAFNPAGTSIIFEGGINQVFQGSLSTAYDLSTATLDAGSFLIDDYIDDAGFFGESGINWNIDGTFLIATSLVTGSTFWHIPVPIAYDLTSIPATGTTIALTSTFSNTQGDFAFNDDFTKVYTTAGNFVHVWDYVQPTADATIDNSDIHEIANAEQVQTITIQDGRFFTWDSTDTLKEYTLPPTVGVTRAGDVINRVQYLKVT